MDELEFRRRVYADPDSNEPDVLAAAAEDRAKKAFLSETRQLNDQIKQAIDIPVPDDLANKLIWQSTMREHARQKKRARYHIAMAASIAFAVGLTFAFWTPGKVDLGNAALAHMHYAQSEQPVAATPVSLERVNAKLASMGGAALSADIGQIYVANYCTLDTVKSLHLIIDGEHGPISVFFLPHDEDTKLPGDFSNDMYEGQGFSIQRANIMVVGNKHTDVDAFSTRVRNSII